MRNLGYVKTAVMVAAECVPVRRDGVVRTPMTLAESQGSDARDLALLNEELGLLIDGATNHAIYMLDPRGHVTIWNRGAERIKGWAQAEILGRHFSLFYPPEDVLAGMPQRDLDRTSLAGRLEEDSWRLWRDGSEFLANITMTALYDEAGALRGFGKVVRDITDQKAAETALARREQHLLSILATVPDAMIVLDEQGRIASFSGAAERMFGYCEADIVGEKADMLFPRIDRDRDGGFLGSYLVFDDRAVAGAVRTVRGQRKNGEIFPVELAVGEALSGGQRIFTGFLRDLTQRHRTGSRLRDVQSELIHVSRLSAMGTMASTLAHELNQPLTAIANYLEATRDLMVDPSPETVLLVRGALDEAAGQSLRAGQIVRRLRDFVARGDVEQRAEPLNALVREAASLGLIGAGQAGVETVMSFVDDSVCVQVDRVQIQQVLVNLIRNALQAMAQSPQRVLTMTSATLRDMVEVTVADTGTGIAPEMTDRLFQAFASTKQDGMGLGLSICQTIVEAHGGRIWAAPVPGGGTAFHFTLMRSSADAG